MLCPLNAAGDRTFHGVCAEPDVAYRLRSRQHLLHLLRIWRPETLQKVYELSSLSITDFIYCISWIVVYSLFPLGRLFFRFTSVRWHCWLGDRKGIRPLKKLDVGLLVVMIWLELCTIYSSSSPVVTTTSFILCFNKHRITQDHLVTTSVTRFFTKHARPRPQHTGPIPIFWSQTGLVLRPTVSDHISGFQYNMLYRHFFFSPSVLIAILQVDLG